MIRKLRRKFILVNMSFVTVVLLIVFGVLCFTSYQRLKNINYGAMQQAIRKGGEHIPPKLDVGGFPKDDFPPASSTVFSVTLNQDGSIASVVGMGVDVSDQLAEKAVQLALASNQKEGRLAELNLRFLMEDTPDGTRIAFADQSGERSSMANLLLTSLLVGIGGLTAFFFISLFLSSWILRPVEQAWEQQRQFVADASHELKTPLTVILANTGILLAHRQERIEDQAKWVEYIKAEADRMKKLVDDLLFLAKSDASRTPALPTSMNFSDVVWSCLLPFESVAFEQGIELNSQIDPEISLVGNEGQLKQLVVILLDNACKYAGEKGKVCLKLTRQGERVRLAVNNTGPAIPQEALGHLFERFYRVDKSRAREDGGYGLGLAIAQTITEQHRGKISVESTEQAGTTFIVNLPIR